MNVFSIFLLKPILILAGSVFAFHPVHVSVTNIEIDTSKQKIEYSIRIFSDDFAYALEHYYEKDIIFTDGISREEKEIVTDYINNMLDIVINGSKCLPEYRNFETLDNSLWVYCDILLNEKEISSLKIINKLMLDFFVDQTNLTIINMNGKQTGYTFDYLNQEAEIELN
jgi:hypothetical protein